MGWRNPQMTTYFVSDLHLDHANIIEYCDRPFDTVAEMNRTLVDNWNAVVDPDDQVAFVGDLAMERDAPVVQGWLNRLNGTILFVEGNHDYAIPVDTHDHYTLSTDAYDLYLTHYPEDIPDEWDGWAIYGHHHNNDPDEYPFVDPENRRVNVSVELLGYEPIPAAELLAHVMMGEASTVRRGVDERRAL
jgi:calcineurin-like phosphoesterase family protein